MWLDGLFSCTDGRWQRRGVAPCLRLVAPQLAPLALNARIADRSIDLSWILHHQRGHPANPHGPLAGRPRRMSSTSQVLPGPASAAAYDEGEGLGSAVRRRG